VLLAEGRIPAPRLRVFPVGECGTAFRYMAKARHIGRVAITHPAAGLPHARKDAAYLVTGGLGALGLQVAEWLAAEGAGHLTLLGRSAPSAEAEQRLSALRASGTTIEIVHGDVADPDMLAFLKGGTRPPLRGIVHAAGIVDDAALSRVDADRLARGLRPKADGAVNLVRATAGQGLDFVVLFSSGSALLGSPGQATYAAANAYLDGLAHRLAVDGVPAVSINWGAWAGRGMAANVDARTAQEWAERGVGMLTAEAGIALLEGAMSRGHAQVAALPLDWPTFVAAIPAAKRPALLAELGVDGGATAEAPTATGTVSIREWLSAQPASERMGALTERLRKEAAAVLGADDPADLEPGAGLMEQGLDSLMAVDLSGRLGRLLGVSLPTTFAFEYPTLNALASHLLAEVIPTEAVRVDVAERADERELDVETLTDAELEAELRRELDQAGF
jgi:NAD(P)-dependent dehydrogenase (short-subunit alcohol dehydrogenase family)/acyl carrier protein